MRERGREGSRRGIGVNLGMQLAGGGREGDVGGRVNTGGRAVAHLASCVPSWPGSHGLGYVYSADLT